MKKSGDCWKSKTDQTTGKGKENRMQANGSRMSGLVPARMRQAYRAGSAQSPRTVGTPMLLCVNMSMNDLNWNASEPGFSRYWRLNKKQPSRKSPNAPYARKYAEMATHGMAAPRRVRPTALRRAARSSAWNHASARVTRK